MNRAYLPICASLLILVACASPDSLTRPVVHTSTAGSAQPDCAAGCWETDPNPSSPGIFLASVVTQDECVAGDYNDVDEDGLGDLCEQRLSDAFNPWLHYYTTDLAWGKEPSYAAKLYWRSGIPVIRILYMPSYYADAGTIDVNYLQGLFDCAGHFGDSEAIVLEVYYNAATQHWVLNDESFPHHTTYTLAYGSGHGDFAEKNPVDQSPVNGDLVLADKTVSMGSYPTYLTYTHGGHLGGAPDVWVAVNKHSNYANQSDCGAGGHGTDLCSANAWEQMGLYDGYVGSRNVGSDNVHFMNCLPARIPPTSYNGYQECYWTGSNFAGWSGITSPVSPGYRVRLTSWGFVNP